MRVRSISKVGSEFQRNSRKSNEVEKPCDAEKRVNVKLPD